MDNQCRQQQGQIQIFTGFIFQKKKKKKKMEFHIFIVLYGFRI